MYSHVEEEEAEHMKLHAMMHGVKFDEDETTPGKEKRQMTTTKPGAEKMPMIFQDPKAYAHMSQEEKEKLTKEMMSVHRGFLQQKGLLVPKKPRL
jgi:hypothetical protein